MDHEQIKTTVLSVMSTVLKCEVGEQASRENLPNWDSLKHIEVIFAIEDELNFQFPEDMLPALNSIERIVNAAEILYAA